MTKTHRPTWQGIFWADALLAGGHRGRNRRDQKIESDIVADAGGSLSILPHHYGAAEEEEGAHCCRHRPPQLILANDLSSDFCFSFSPSLLISD